MPINKKIAINVIEYDRLMSMLVDASTKKRKRASQSDFTVSDCGDSDCGPEKDELKALEVQSEVQSGK